MRVICADKTPKQKPSRGLLEAEDWNCKSDSKQEEKWKTHVMCLLGAEGSSCFTWQRCDLISQSITTTHFPISAIIVTERRMKEWVKEYIVDVIKLAELTK